MTDIKSVADEADIIVNGYAFKLGIERGWFFELFEDIDN